MSQRLEFSKQEGEEKKTDLEEKWDIGESNPVLLLNCLAGASRKVAGHRTPGRVPSFNWL
jgi:hypothetical protein